jgi:hypothetical protein
VRGSLTRGQLRIFHGRHVRFRLGADDTRKR